MGSMESAARKDSSSDYEGSSTDSSQSPDTDNEGLSVHNRVQQWERNMGSSARMEPMPRSRAPSPQSPENVGTEDERASLQMCAQQWEEGSLWSAAEIDPTSRSQERLSVQHRVQLWERSTGSSALREPTSRSWAPSPHSPQNTGTEDERASVQTRVQQREGRRMWSEAERDPTSRSQGSSTDCPNIPASEGETLSAQRRLQMWEECVRQALGEEEPALSTESPAQAEESTSARYLEQSTQGEPTEVSRTASQEELSTKSTAESQLEEAASQSTHSREGPSKEETEVQLRRQLEQTTIKLQEQIEANQSLQKIADLQKQLEEEKMQNEAQRKETERRDEQLLKEREESEFVKHAMTIAQSKIEELQSEFQTLRQTNTGLQQQLSRATAVFAKHVEDDIVWKQTVQKQLEEKERELTETITLNQETIKVLQSDLQDEQQANYDLGRELSEASTAMTELKEAEEVRRRTVQEERKEKEKTIAKKQETIEELHDEILSHLQTNTDLRQQLISSNAAIVKLIGTNEKWIERMQKEREMKEREIIAKNQEDFERLHSELQFQRQTNSDLQQQLSWASAAIVRLTDAHKACRQTEQEEREKKEEELTETIGKMQEAVNRQEQQESELEMFREEKRRKEERKRRRWWRFWRRN